MKNLNIFLISLLLFSPMVSAETLNISQKINDFLEETSLEYLLISYNKLIFDNINKKDEFFLELKKIKLSKAYYLIGNLYFVGNEALNIPKNHENAFSWFEKAQKLKHSESINFLGIMKKNGLGTDKDNEQAVTYFKEAINIDNNKKSYNNLGQMYLGGIGVKKDLNKAIENFDISAASGDISSMYLLGLIYSSEQKYKQSLKWYNDAASKGHTESQYKIGTVYHYGNKDIKKNTNKAIEWYEKSSKNGHSESFNALGLIAEGEDDFEKAERLYLKSINIDNNNALFNLAKLYIQSKQYKKAIKFFQKAIDKNDSAAMNSLGVMYLRGQGVKLDYDEAIRYFTLSIETDNNLHAQANLALMYDNGFGVKLDKKKAKSLYKTPAKLGVTLAQMNLSKIYHDEENIPKEKKWLELAANNNSSEALTSLGNIAYGLENYKKAHTYYTKAIEVDNNPVALTNLGSLYFRGYGIKQSLKKARELYKEASKQKYDYALFLLSNVLDGNEIMSFSQAATVLHIRGVSSFPSSESADHIKKQALSKNEAAIEILQAFKRPDVYKKIDKLEY